MLPLVMLAQLRVVHELLLAAAHRAAQRVLLVMRALDVRQQPRPVLEHLPAPRHVALVRRRPTPQPKEKRGNSFVWERRCGSSIRLVRNAALHPGKSHLNGRSPYTPSQIVETGNRVLELMLVELRGGSESLVAALHVAEIRLFVAVDAKMTCQTALRREELLADLALERLLSTRPAGLTLM